MNNLKLFSVNVRQTWQSEADVFVLADSQEEAEKASKQIVNLSSYEDTMSEIEATSVELSIFSLNDLKSKSDYWFIAKDKDGCFDYFEFEEFKSFISEEQLEAMRIQRIEKNNGQLALTIENQQ